MMRLTSKRFSRDRLTNCLECGYSLHGAMTGRCSECGHPIDRNVDVHLPLERAPRRIILALAWRMTAITILMAVLLPVTMVFFGRFADGSSAFALVMCGPLILSSVLISVWWRDPVAISNGFGPHDPIRRLTRWGGLIWLVLGTGSLLSASGLMTGTVIPAVFDFLWGVVCLGCLFQVFLLFVCLERLAHWMRDEFAGGMIRFIHLSLMVIALGVLVGIIGPILFPISPGLFPVYAAIVFVVMMIMVIVLLLVMSKGIWFTLVHHAENQASDHRVRQRFDEQRTTAEQTDTRL